MTGDELCGRYRISARLLEEYVAMGLKASADNQYDDKDVKHIGMMLTLKEVGFHKNEIKEYMRMYLACSNVEQRMNMLNKRRASTLDKIHAGEEQLSKIDALRHRVQNSGEKDNLLQMRQSKTGKLAHGGL